MGNGLIKGDFAHVVGTFDLAGRTGTIDYVTPVRTGTVSSDPADEGIHLIGEDANKRQLFDQPVKPQRNSCAPHAQQGTFEAFIPVSAQLRTIGLTIGGTTVAKFSRGQQTTPAALSFGAPDPRAPHKVPLNMAAKPVGIPGVTYTVQAKADDAGSWQTLAVGLSTPTTFVDVNQFPGAKNIKVRVLQSDGFAETEIFHDVRTF